MAEDSAFKNEELSGDLLLDFFEALNDYHMGGNNKKSNLKEKLIELSISNAYDDATRQGAYNVKVKNKTQSRTIKEKAKQVLKKGNKDKLLGIDGLLDLKVYIDEYDTWHMHLCQELTDKVYNSIEEFTYGNAQKWVNMTVKYLYIYSYILDDMSEFSGEKNPLGGILNYKSKFHIPLDSYILRALFYVPTKRNKKYSYSIRKKINEKYDGDKLIEYKMEEDRQPSLVNVDGALNIKHWEKIDGNEGILTWSNIPNNDEYKVIQEAVKNKIPEESEFKSNPLIWENKVWNLAAGIIKK